ncbi:MAG: hypothetical protein K2W95_04340 [Candidatus Obscuribacterales bacterium]|nr:hypothetical protein [Candidatus Obscuribacterales bacterium]
MENRYLVAMGALVMTQNASSARRALSMVKEKLRCGNTLPMNLRDPQRFSASLLEAFEDGRLNFLVMDSTRTRLFCGENRGVYEEPVSLGLAEHFARLIPEETLREHRALSHLYAFDYSETA